MICVSCGRFGLILALLISSSELFAQQAVTIRVDTAQRMGRMNPVWAYFGYDEPNYTYAENGRKLIGELAATSESPVHIRTHNLLTTGNGAAALKWGSTNAYTEDAAGKPVYDWTIVDKILGTYVQLGAKPLVEIGFMPKALSTHPEPYQHTFPKGDIYTGWSYPPNDYGKWSELIYQWVKHTADTYGKAEVETWDWEVWNEPDISYWHGSPEEYDKLFDFTTAAVKRALPGAKVGGPGSTGPANAKAGAFLRQFLEHCASGKNEATHGTGTPLDFITYHVKGKPDVADGHVRMGLSHEMKDFAAGLKIVSSFEKFRNLPIVLTEADPEGCAACSAQTNPANGYRNGTMYPAYTAVALKTMLELAAREHANLHGALTWAFEFEDQPFFAGFRDLATNGIDKPVLNLFRMAGLMRGDTVKTESDGAVTTDAIVASGVREKSDVDALAARSDHSVSVMVWNYQDDDARGPAALVKLDILSLPDDQKRVLVRHYRVDQDHSNAYTRWKLLGSPQHPDPGAYSDLEQAGQLQMFDSPRWTNAREGSLHLQFELPLHAISLIEVGW